MQLTLTPDTMAEFAKVLECRKTILLSGRNAYIDRAYDAAAVRAVSLLMQSNPVQTGLADMLADVEKITADENGEFAAKREQLAIESDEHGNRNKAHVAHLKQTLDAVKLERQHAQEVVF